MSLVGYDIAWWADTVVTGGNPARETLLTTRCDNPEHHNINSPKYSAPRS
jgi:hypothetical protein